MLLETLQAIRDNILPLTFVCHFFIFLGGFYVALHSRLLPLWVTTGLWYVGLASIANCFGIIFQWIYGVDFPLSYENTRIITETLFALIIAVNIAMFFSDTVLKDISGVKNRTKI